MKTVNPLDRTRVVLFAFIIAVSAACQTVQASHISSQCTPAVIETRPSESKSTESKSTESKSTESKSTESNTTRSQPVTLHSQPSQALRDPLIEEARELKIVDDFKTLADLIAKPVTDQQVKDAEENAKQIEKQKGRPAAVKYLLDTFYESRRELLDTGLKELQPRFTIAVTTGLGTEVTHKATVDYIERTWNDLVRKTPTCTDSSLIPLPNPLMIPGSRFQEGYYWDSYFASEALILTGRADIVKGQVDNFLFLIQNYGLVPNGTRDYYLSRSQPPVLSHMIRLVIENEQKHGGLTAQTKQWLQERALPLLKKDYKDFWMNPKTHFEESTGLNHHFDKLDTPRPERHATDKETELAKTFRDVRAEAESGKDFTAAFGGEATHVNGVLLNSVLYQVEKDIAWFSNLVGDSGAEKDYKAAADKRKDAMNKYLWDEKSGTFRDYNFRTHERSPVLTADTFIPLYVELASGEQAHKIRENLKKLEHKGGLASSDLQTGKQWDGIYGWAPLHYFAIAGLKNYGFQKDARRLANKWISSNDNVLKSTGKLIEKIDVEKGGVPEEKGDKYPTQDGFLWTNGVYLWSLVDVLGVQLQPIP